MNRDDQAASTSDVPQSDKGALKVLGSIADTTWRMFIPTIGFLMIGRYFDNTLSIKPWGMLIGVIVGIWLAYVLVRKQLRDIERENKK